MVDKKRYSFSREEYLKQLKKIVAVEKQKEIDKNIMEMTNVLLPLTIKLNEMGIKITSPYDYEDILLGDKFLYKKALPHILEFFQSCDDTRGKEYLSHILATRLARPDAELVLINDFKKEYSSDQNPRVEIATALITVGSKRYLKELAELFLDKKYGRGRTPLAYAIAKIGKKEEWVKGVLKKALSDDEIAAYATSALVMIKDKSALPMIEPLLNHSNEVIRQAAERAVKKLKKIV